MEQCLYILLNLIANSGNERFDLGGNGNAAVEEKAAVMQLEQFFSKKTIQTSWVQQGVSDYMTNSFMLLPKHLL